MVKITPGVCVQEIQHAPITTTAETIQGYSTMFNSDVVMYIVTENGKFRMAQLLMLKNGMLEYITNSKEVDDIKKSIIPKGKLTEALFK